MGKHYGGSIYKETIMNDNTETELNTGNVIPFMYGKEIAESGSWEVDDTVNIPRGEYEDLLEDSAFLDFLEYTVGPDVWENACNAFESWNEEDDDEA
jgi:hypothetical protein